jgi:hypothetical protein
MKKIGLTANSPELHEFFEGIYRFYHETADKLVKYLTTPLTNRLNKLKI